jgi:regulator of sigma E protease
MLGEEPDSEVSEEELEHSFSHQPVFKRVAIVLAGPLSNLILAIFIFVLVFTFSGIPRPSSSNEIGSVTPGSPADQAGIQTGDKIVEIDDRPITKWEELSQTIRGSGGKTLQLSVQRGEEIFTVEVSPRVQEVKNIFGEIEERRPLIGVTASFYTEKINPLMAGYYSLIQTWDLCKLFFLTVVKLIQRVLPMDTLGGPILIGQMAGQQAKEGLIPFVYLIAVISVNLGVLNLLPIPILDGGHLFFFLLEAIMGRPIEVKKVEIAQKVGLCLLLMLMILVFYNDIMRLVLKKAPIP